MVGIRCGGSRRALRVTYGRGSCPRSLSLRGQACHSEGDRDAALAIRQQAERVRNVRRRCRSTPMSSRSIRTNVSLCCTHSRQGCFTYAGFTSSRCFLYTNKLVRIISTIYCPRFCDVAGWRPCFCFGRQVEGLLGALLPVFLKRPGTSEKPVKGRLTVFVKDVFSNAAVPCCSLCCMCRQFVL